MSTFLADGLHDLTTRPPGNAPLLDVLRTAAILLVFSTHFSGEFHGSASILALPFVYYGWTGVDLFFVLSGYLIGSQLWKELKTSGQIRIGRFLLRRGLRIWPLYYSVVLFLIAEVVFTGRPAGGLLADATFLSNYLHCQVGGGWSLSTEEQFYIVAPVCMFLLSRVVELRRLWIAPAAALAFTIGCRFLVIRSSHLDFRALQQSLYFPIHTHADGLAIGLLLAFVTTLYPEFFRSTRRLMLSMGVMTAVAVGLYAANRILFSYTSLGLIFGALTCLGISSIVLPRFVSWRGFFVMSRLSYGTYLNHFGLLPLLYSVMPGKLTAPGGPRYWLCYLLSLTACLLFATGTFLAIEYPFLALRSRWLARLRDRQLKAAG